LTIPKSVIIVGSGLTGLILSQSLQNRGYRVLLLDKGRKPGGRLLSKRIGGSTCNIGPGWFHTLADMTPDFLETALAAVSAEPIAFENLPTSVQAGLPSSQSLRSWKIPGGMRQLTDVLARPLDVLQSIQLKSIKKQGSEWLLDCVDTAHGDDAIEIPTPALVLTTPWPQALEILQKSELMDDDFIRPFAGLPDYNPCLVAAFELAGAEAAGLQPISLEPAGDETIQRVQLEPCPTGPCTALVHATPGFSARHWADTDETVMAALKQHTRRHLKISLQSAPALLHRWKYATLQRSGNVPTKPVLVSQAPTLILAGEAFGLLPQMQSGILAAQNSAKLADALMA